MRNGAVEAIAKNVIPEEANAKGAPGGGEIQGKCLCMHACILSHDRVLVYGLHVSQNFLKPLNFTKF